MNCINCSLSVYYSKEHTGNSVKSRKKLTTQKDFSNTKTELHVFRLNQILQAIDRRIWVRLYQRERCPQTSASSFPDLPHSSCLLPVNWLGGLYFRVPVNNGPRSSLVLYRHETKNDRSPTMGFIYLPACFCPR